MSGPAQPRPAPLAPGHLLRAAPTLLRVAVAEMVAYRAEIVIWILTSTLPLIMLFVWDRVAEGGPVQGFDQAGFAAYFAAMLVVRQLAGSWVVWELNHQIRSGGLSPMLLKPLHPVAFFAAENLGDKPIRALVLVPIVGAIAYWRPGLVAALDPSSLGVLLVSLLCAWGLNFAVQLCFGCLAFHLDQSVGLFKVWFGLYALASGYLFPLALLPDWARVLCEQLPFRAMLAFPVEVATGLVQGPALWRGLALQVAWLAAALLLARWLWRSGVRRYEAFGA